MTYEAGDTILLWSGVELVKVVRAQRDFNARDIRALQKKCEREGEPYLSIYTPQEHGFWTVVSEKTLEVA